MRFVESKVENLHYKTTALCEFLTQFLESDYETAEVVDHHYASAYSAQAAIRSCAKRFHLGVDCRVRNGKIYLIRRH